MAGNSEGARKAAETRRKKYGEDHYRKIGSLGGQSRKRDYFSELKKSNPDELKKISKLGRKKSKQGFEKFSKEKHQEASSLGGKASVRNRRSRGISEGGDK